MPSGPSIRRARPRSSRRRSRHLWQDGDVDGRALAAQERDAPISIYEVHLGSWRRDERGGYLTYRELAEQLVPYAADIGLHAYRGAAGHRVSVRRLLGLSADRRCSRRRRGLARPTISARLSTPATAPGSGSLLDWVPGAFPDRRARSRPVRRHRALRARRPAAGLPSRLEHADLQLRPPRGREFPAVERALLAARVSISTGSGSMPSPRCSTSTTAASRANGSRTSSAGARTSTRSPSCGA